MSPWPEEGKDLARFTAELDPTFGNKVYLLFRDLMGSSTGSSGPLVLVVDDDVDVRDTMVHTLGQRGFDVIVASGKVEAMALFQQYQDRISVLVADISLPGEKPGDLARAVAASYPRIKIVYVTGIPRHIALAAGIVGSEVPYLAKPVSPDVLAGLLQGLLPRFAAPPRGDW
nr:hypothetical protein Ade03nite_91440 [Actinoplanes derwentensis]